jgi:ParB family chromosome partitioning protein
MSIKDRLAKKTEGLLLPTKQAGAAGSGQAPLKTGPGQMLMVNSLMRETNEKVAVLENRLREYEGTLPVRLIEPQKIVPSKWANRIEPSFESADFRQLKEEIASAEGNVQPIKVRPLKGDPDRYEIVYGHRRHRACLELNLPVLALVEDVSDQELFKEMDRENRARLDLSPWEQGVMYRRALNEELFSSMGELAKELGVDKGNVSRALKLADLPQAVVDAFPSPLDLQFRWAKLLSDAIQQDPEGVMARVEELEAHKADGLSSKEVLDLLTGKVPTVPTVQTVVVDGKVIAEIVEEGRRVQVKFAKDAVPSERITDLQVAIKAFFKQKT